MGRRTYYNFRNYNASVLQIETDDKYLRHIGHNPLFPLTFGKKQETKMKEATGKLQVKTVITVCLRICTTTTACN